MEKIKSKMIRERLVQKLLLTIKVMKRIKISLIFQISLTGFKAIMTLSLNKNESKSKNLIVFPNKIRFRYNK